jgi:hypothetical protein
MKIHVYAQGDWSALQLLDFYQAYQQWLAQDQGWVSPIEIEISSEIETCHDAFNIGWFYMPEQPVPTEQFDLVLLDNCHHGLEFATPHILQALQHDNCYFVAGAYLMPDHALYHKVIWLPMFLTTRDYMTRPQYPQYFDLDREPVQREGMVFINGQNRANRQYFMNLINDSGVRVHNRWPSASPLLDCMFESEDDRIYRELVNQLPDLVSYSDQYYNLGVAVGMHGRFGQVPIGYFFMPEYFQSACVIFPESNWINDEVFMTEKIIKCFASGAIPWPIGGANINRLYRQLGYVTACDLLPDNLKSYDAKTDHAERHQACADAIRWAVKHPEIWHSPEAQSAVRQNRERFYLSHHDADSARRLHQIVTKHAR